MFNKIRLSLSLLDRKSRNLITMLTAFRALIALLDILGILLIGLLLSKAAQQITTVKSSSTPFNIDLISEKYSLQAIAIFALMAFLSKSALAVFTLKFMAKTLASSENKVVKTIFENFFKINRDDFSNFSNSEISFALTFSPIFAITNLITMWTIIVGEIALLISIGILFIFIDFKIFIGIFFYFGLIGYGIYKVLGERMQSAGRQYTESATLSGQVVEDSVNAIREILTLRKESEFIEKFSKNRYGLSHASAYVNFYPGMPRYIIESALIFGTLILAGYVFSFGDAASGAGILGIFLTGGLRITASIIPLQSALATIKQFIAQSEPFFNIIEKTKLIESQPEIVKSNSQMQDLDFAVAFNQVSFSYPGSTDLAINDISFTISPGEFVAFIGPSGSGKSTIADLIIGFIKPTSGEVLNKLSQIVPRRIGYVPQSPGMVRGSILDNITLNVNSHEFNNEALVDSLNSAHLNELISSLEQGVNTKLGAQSDALSGGQLQRIGLARAIYSNPSLLILDEATSALDAETEAAVSESLDAMKGVCTIVVIAHRLTTVKNADRVFVVEDGKISASGKFSELVKTNEIVSRYVELSEIIDSK